ncbi:MAG: hypothetical protein SynsKO_44300 [Synoicihabitans sp.]
MNSRGAMSLILALALGTAFAASPSRQVSSTDLTKARAVLREGLRSEEFWPAMHAAEAMTIAGLQDEVVVYLKPKLADEKDDQRRCGLARELVRAGERYYAAVMFDILQSDDPHGHVHAAESLFKVGWQGRYDPLTKAFNESDNVILRLMAAGALAQHGLPESRAQGLKFLRDVMSHSSAVNDYRIAAWVLGRTGEPEDAALIRSRLADTTDPRARAFLHHALAVFGDEVGRAKLRENLISENAAFRTYAATFAGDARMSEVVPLLVELLDDENLDTRIRAAQSIFALRNITSSP